MHMTFLGTSSGTPTTNRNVSALALGVDNSKFWYLVDCGEGTQHRLLRTRFSLSTLKLICITHVHGDHCYGLPGLLASANMASRELPLTIIGPQALQQWIASVQTFTELNLGFPLRFIDVNTCSEWSDEDVSVVPVELSHRVPSHAFCFIEQVSSRNLDLDKLNALGLSPGPLYGQLQRGDTVTLPDGTLLDGKQFLKPTRAARKAVIAGDNDNPGLLAEACRDAHVLVHEATYTDDVLEKIGAHPQHSSAGMVARFAESVALNQLLLTHFSPRYQDDKQMSPNITEIEQEAKSYFGGPLYLARDFDCYQLDKNGGMRLQSPPPDGVKTCL